MVDKKKDAECEISISPEFNNPDMTPEEQEKFLNEHPTRGEVANFVGQYLANDILPQVIGYINQQDNRNLALISICQAVLISQGVISKEQMDELVNNWNNKKEKKDKDSSIPGVIK